MYVQKINILLCSVPKQRFKENPYTDQLAF